MQNLEEKELRIPVEEGGPPEEPDVSFLTSLNLLLRPKSLVTLMVIVMMNFTNINRMPTNELVYDCAVKVILD